LKHITNTITTMINKVILLGHTGKDPEIKTLSSGKKVASFSLATSEKYQDKEVTQWHSVTAWDKLAEILEKYVKKGQLLYVEGKITYRSYDDKDGNKKYVTDIVASQIQMIGSKKDNAAENTGSSDSDESPF
jgi:single-strand DNA-binding protein